VTQRDEIIESTEDRTSADLLARIRPARAALVAVVERLSDEQLLRPHPVGGWSAIGHLTHIAAWERMIVAHLTDGRDHDVVRMTPEEYARASLDELNLRIYELHRDEPPAVVRAEFDAAHAAIVDCIRELSPEALAARYWPDQERTAAEKIAGDTYLHYDEHRAWILEMFDARATGDTA
jgi:hypothetical protein